MLWENLMESDRFLPKDRHVNVNQQQFGTLESLAACKTTWGWSTSSSLAKPHTEKMWAHVHWDLNNHWWNLNSTIWHIINSIHLYNYGKLCWKNTKTRPISDQRWCLRPTGEAKVPGSTARLLIISSPPIAAQALRVIGGRGNKKQLGCGQTDSLFKIAGCLDSGKPTRSLLPYPVYPWNGGRYPAVAAGPWATLAMDPSSIAPLQTNMLMVEMQEAMLSSKAALVALEYVLSSDSFTQFHNTHCTGNSDCLSGNLREDVWERIWRLLRWLSKN